MELKTPFSTPVEQGRPAPYQERLLDTAIAAYFHEKAGTPDLETKDQNGHTIRAFINRADDKARFPVLKDWHSTFLVMRKGILMGAFGTRTAEFLELKMNHRPDTPEDHSQLPAAHIPRLR